MTEFEERNDSSSQLSLENGKTFSEYFHMLVKHWKLMLIFVFISVLVGFTYDEFFKQAEYQASGSCMVLADKSEDESIDSDDVNYSLILLATVNTFMQDEPVIEAVTTDLNQQGYNLTTADVTDMLTVEPDNYTSSSKSLYLSVTATSHDKQLSIALVNSCMDNAVEITNTNEEYTFFKNTIVITSEATNATDISTSSTLIYLLSGFAGLFLYGIIAIILELTNVYCLDKKGIENLTDKKVLAIIPDYSNEKIKNKFFERIKKRLKKNKDEEEVALITDYNTPAGESIQQLQANISFYNLHSDTKVIGITSSNRSECKSTTICNLANLYAEKGAKVCVVNLDIRRPSVHHILNVKNKVGVVEYVRGETDLDHVIQHAGKLDVISSGTINPFPTKIIESPEMKKLIDRLRGMYEYIFVDTPPVLSVSDTLFAVHLVDGFLITCVQNETRKGSLRTTIETLENVNCNIIGIVMNKVTVFSKDYSDHYKYYKYNKQIYRYD